MNKNIIVLDESGNEIGATYFKRARGLVKKGRARFVSETAIRLACPPSHSDEEDKMQNNNIIEEIEKTEEVTLEKAVAEAEKTVEMAEEMQKSEGEISQMPDSPADPVKEKARLLEKLMDMCQQVAISNDYSADEFSDIVNGILDSIRHM